MIDMYNIYPCKNTFFWYLECLALIQITDTLNLEGDQLAAQLVKRRLKEEAGEELDDEPAYEKVKINNQYSFTVI